MRRRIMSRYCAIKSDSYWMLEGPLDQSTSDQDLVSCCLDGEKVVDIDDTSVWQANWKRTTKLPSQHFADPLHGRLLLELIHC